MHRFMIATCRVVVPSCSPVDVPRLLRRLRLLLCSSLSSSLPSRLNEPCALILRTYVNPRVRAPRPYAPPRGSINTAPRLHAKNFKQPRRKTPRVEELGLEEGLKTLLPAYHPPLRKGCRERSYQGEIVPDCSSSTPVDSAHPPTFQKNK